jgi:hypothetical protein
MDPSRHGALVGVKSMKSSTGVVSVSLTKRLNRLVFRVENLQPPVDAQQQEQ